MKAINTRIAPSPTGFFHLGTARTAYLNYLVARATGGKFILRIDDTDDNRNDAAYTQYIFDVFDWLKLDYDLCIHQSKRKDFYLDIANKLLATDKALKLDNGAIALKVPTNMPSTWKDYVAGDIKITDQDLRSMANLILMKQDGTPTYNFCSILDDIDCKIDWIMRGTDHLSNTPKQVAIMTAVSDIMDVPDMTFVHIGLIHDTVDEVNKKMSKRHGAKSVLDFKDQGYNADAFLNYIMRLGWSPSMPSFDSIHKTVSRDLAKDIIFKGNFRAAKATFDINKLNYLDKLYKRNGSVG